jgi:hypothetical protein
VFNLADSAIVVGVCVAVLLAARGVPFDADTGLGSDADGGSRP